MKLTSNFVKIEWMKNFCSTCDKSNSMLKLDMRIQQPSLQMNKLYVANAMYTCFKVHRKERHTFRMDNKLMRFLYGEYQWTPTIQVQFISVATKLRRSSFFEDF